MQTRWRDGGVKDAPRLQTAAQPNDTRVLGAQLSVAALIVFGVANRVLYKLALVPMGDYVFFLAQFQTFGYCAVYFTALFVRYKCASSSPAMCYALRQGPAAAASAAGRDALHVRLQRYRLHCLSGHPTSSLCRGSAASSTCGSRLPGGGCWLLSVCCRSVALGARRTNTASVQRPCRTVIGFGASRGVVSEAAPSDAAPEWGIFSLNPNVDAALLACQPAMVCQHVRLDALLGLRRFRWLPASPLSHGHDQQPTAAVDRELEKRKFSTRPANLEEPAAGPAQ